MIKIKVKCDTIGRCVGKYVYQCKRYRPSGSATLLSVIQCKLSWDLAAAETEE